MGAESTAVVDGKEYRGGENGSEQGDRGGTDVVFKGRVSGERVKNMT